MYICKHIARWMGFKYGLTNIFPPCWWWIRPIYNIGGNKVANAGPTFGYYMSEYALGYMVGSFTAFSILGNGGYYLGRRCKRYIWKKKQLNN